MVASKPREQIEDQQPSERLAVLRSLQLLWRHKYFRQLLAVRIVIQSSDGILQIALASYVLFSPERQPDAVSIAIVLAITLLPFSILGPFAAVLIDRISRRQVLIYANLARAVVTLALAALVATGLQTVGVEALIYGGVLLAMSINRFLLAALSAALPHTIDPAEYMIANSVVPTLGPAGLLIGVAVATPLRLILGHVMPDYRANAILFLIAFAGFVLSAILALWIPRRQLGPDKISAPKASEVITGLIEAIAHLRRKRAAGIGLMTIAAHRLIYGIVTVSVILVYRIYFHTLDQLDAAIADLGLLVVITGAGFVFASVVTPPMSARLGVRNTITVSLLASAVFQLVPGSIYARVPLMVAAFFLGLTAQAIKICVDTLVQAHVADEVKGRVFAIYDMIFNVALVLAAVIAAVILPANGKSAMILIIMAVCYLLIGVWFSMASRGVRMNKGTESLQIVT
ncbi:MAG TPA: MFS transporter [Propionibacteriaceae bacterium]|nr:MFS transporter [Propionibacteriaceae bacterium]